MNTVVYNAVKPGLITLLYMYVNCSSPPFRFTRVLTYLQSSYQSFHYHYHRLMLLRNV